MERKNKSGDKNECPIPCKICWETEGQACFDARCPKEGNKGDEKNEQR